MTNPTSNYGFVLPTSTDLVTDLPADFDVALQGVDTRLKALQPGTTLGDIAYSSATANTNTRLGIGTSGQVLAVSGGGVPAWTTTADVTPLTTKGDLFTFTTVDARLGVGTNGQVLQADSAEATGLKWATPSSGTPAFVGCSLKFNSDQTLSNATNLLVAFDQEYFDTNTFHDNATNNTRITIPASYAGKYLITANISTSAWNNDSRVSIFKNGSPIAVSFLRWNAPDLTSANVYFIADLAVSDYLQINMFQSSGSSQTVKGQSSLGAGSSFFQVQFLGA